MPFMHSGATCLIHEEGLKLFSEVGLELHLAYEEDTAVWFGSRRDPSQERNPGTRFHRRRRTSI